MYCIIFLRGLLIKIDTDRNVKHVVTAQTTGMKYIIKFYERFSKTRSNELYF